MHGRCQCGRIEFDAPGEPLALFACHCSECRHQSSSLFGLTAIFPSFDIPEPHRGAIGTYMRHSLSGRDLKCLFCTNCGSRLVHRADGEKQLSVKGGCLEGEVAWDKAVHIWCKEAAAGGIGIPKGAKRYEEEPPEEEEK